jgi:hypothetical protein
VGARLGCFERDGELKRTTIVIILLGITACGLAAGSFLMGGPRSAIDWRSLRAVVIESDDWGLAGFVPDADSWRGLDRDELDTGSFPGVYWLSTLEDSSMVSKLNLVLSGHLGRDGHPAVLQPNYVMSSLAHDGEQWVSYDLPHLPPMYQRPGLWIAVEKGVAGGTWYPEFHATWHYDPDLRKKDALGSDIAQKVTDRGILLFPGSERAKELGLWRSEQDLEEELDHSLTVFLGLFGRDVTSVMAPDYHWDDRIETMWESRNLKVIQGKREQRNPSLGTGKSARLRKYVLRQWARLRHPGRTYLERNCRLEPVQAPDPDSVVKACVEDTRRAWAAGQPAVVESHRVNFAHSDSALVALGRDALDHYLEEISAYGDDGPVFLTDHELAQLYARGTSWCVRGEVVVVRNATRGRKVVSVPAEAFESIADQGGQDAPRISQRGILVIIPGASTIDLVP